jgi:hypothetical protein
MNRLSKSLQIVGMAAVALGALSTSARANPVLDFKTVGSLNFTTDGLDGTNFVQIDGYLPTAGIGSSSSPVGLMGGTFSGFSLNSDPIANTVNGLGNAVGWAVDSPLSTFLGLSTDLQYTFLGWSMTTDPLAVGTAGTALSTDIHNTAVPEPGSIVLLGSGLLYAAGSFRRRFNL